MEITDLKYLLAVAGEANFSRAARLLGINASTISRRVSRFEDELGFTLFERSRTGVRVTSGGQEIVRGARRVVAEFDA